jgi:hypothetical protein
MPSKSVDRVFLQACVVKNLISQDEAEQLKLELQRRHEKTQLIDMQELFSELEVLEDAEWKRVLRAVSKHARRCLDCARYTYLLPGQRSKDLLCEHCEGQLLAGRIDPEAQAARDRRHKSITTEYAHNKLQEYIEKSGAFDIRAFRRKPGKEAEQDDDSRD